MSRVSAVFLLMLLPVCFSVTCRRSDTGGFEFFDKNKPFTPEPFDCIQVQLSSNSAQNVLPPSSSGSSVCAVSTDSKDRTSSRYEKSAVSTGLTCIHECREQPNVFHCTGRPAGGECPCEPKGPRVVIKAISSALGAQALSGQSDKGETLTCDGKEAGFAFPDAVPCLSVRADVVKRRVWFKKGSETKCRFKTGSATETRYVAAEPTELNLQACMWVCKKAAPRCETLTGGDECHCKSPGLQKILVGLNQDEMNGMVRMSGCTSDSVCGDCGFCDEDGLCQLIDGSSLGNYCSCGKICPTVDLRENKVSEVACVLNTALGCMAKPEWLSNGSGKAYFAGTENVQDFCYDGENDAADTCGCAPGYSETFEWDEDAQASLTRCACEDGNVEKIIWDEDKQAEVKQCVAPMPSPSAPSPTPLSADMEYVEED